MLYVRRLASVWLLSLCVATAAMAGQSTGTIEGVVTDSSGARLPGVTVEVVATPRGVKAIAVTTTDSEGAYRLSPVGAGEYVVRFALSGFSRPELKASVTPGATVSLPVKLEVNGLAETVNVVANTIALDVSSSTQTSSFSSEALTELPSASRNYTHVIVAEAGVSAPLPDRTGRGLNIATNPGTQAEDSSQSLNPSVNGARPTNNGLRINGVDATNMLNASGGLGNSINIPLDALEEVEVQTSLPSASRGRNGGGNIELITRSGTDRYSGSAGYYFQHERFNSNEFFLNRAGVEKPEFRRNDTTITLGGPALRSRTHFFGSVQRQGFKSGYASNATAATGLPTGLTDVRNADTIAAVANQWIRTGMQDDPRFAQNFMNALRAFPAEQQAGLIAKFFADPARLDLPRADARGHPSGGAQHPEHEARRTIADSVADRKPAAAQRQRHLRPGVSATAGRSYRVEQPLGVRLPAAPHRRLEPDAADAHAIDPGRRGSVRLGGRVAVAHTRPDAGVAWGHLELPHVPLAHAA